MQVIILFFNQKNFVYIPKTKDDKAIARIQSTKTTKQKQKEKLATSSA